MSDSYDYDLVCIGSGPAGQRAAVQAAKLGHRAAVVEKRRAVGGVCIVKHFPATLAVVGARGVVIGIEYTSIFAALGVAVTLVGRSGRDAVRRSSIGEIADESSHQCARRKSRSAFGEAVESIEVADGPLAQGGLAHSSPASASSPDMVLDSAGRTPHPTP